MPILAPCVHCGHRNVIIAMQWGLVCIRPLLRKCLVIALPRHRSAEAICRKEPDEKNHITNSIVSWIETLKPPFQQAIRSRSPASARCNRHPLARSTALTRYRTMGRRRAHQVCRVRSRRKGRTALDLMMRQRVSLSERTMDRECPSLKSRETKLASR